MEIREYSDEYRQQVKDLITDIYDDERGREKRVRKDLDVIEERYQDNDGNFWVAVKEGKVIGTIGLINQGENRASLHRFAVLKDFRGKEKGVSAKLYSTLLDFARSHGYRKIFLGTVPEAVAGIRFYEREGWVRINSLPEDIAKHPQFAHDDILYELNL